MNWKRDGDVLKHRAALERICIRLKDKGAMNRWSLEEAIDHALPLAFELLSQYYDPQRGNVTTFLYRVMPGRMVRLYLTEHGRDFRGRRPDTINRLPDRACGRTPLDELLDEERAAQTRRDANSMIMAMAESDKGTMLAAWTRAGRARGSRSIGVSSSQMGDALRAFRHDMGLGKHNVYWFGV